MFLRPRDFLKENLKVSQTDLFKLLYTNLFKDEKVIKIIGKYERNKNYTIFPEGNPIHCSELVNFIQKEKIKPPSAEEISEVLVRACMPPFEFASKKLHDILDNRTVLTSTRLLEIKEGLYGYDLPEKENESSLKEKLSVKEDRGVFYSIDGNVRYAIRNTQFFCVGYQIKKTDLEEDSVIRVIANEKGARNLARLNNNLCNCETTIIITENTELFEEQKHFLVGISIRDDDDYGYDISIKSLREDSKEFVYGIEI